MIYQVPTQPAPKPQGMGVATIGADGAMKAMQGIVMTLGALFLFTAFRRWRK